MIPTVVTVNDPEALSPPTLVAITIVPDVPFRTENVHVKAPELSVISEPGEQLKIGTWSNTREANGVNTENPVPRTVTDAPTGPCPGITAIASGVTVNETEFELCEVATSVPTTL